MTSSKGIRPSDFDAPRTGECGHVSRSELVDSEPGPFARESKEGAGESRLVLNKGELGSSIEEDVGVTGKREERATGTGDDSSSRVVSALDFLS